jgi:hypothetical protein
VPVEEVSSGANKSDASERFHRNWRMGGLQDTCEFNDGVKGAGIRTPLKAGEEEGHALLIRKQLKEREPI